jgi:hypothetical protein
VLEFLISLDSLELSFAAISVNMQE